MNLIKSDHPIYRELILKWYSMRYRCYKESDINYSNYGARGIRVCDEWMNSRDAFVFWSIENGWEPGLQIDKMDNDGDYSPENCQYLSHYNNQHNQQPTRRNNSSGYAGVMYREAKGKYTAYITSKPLNGKKSIHIGIYDTKEQAVKARNKFITENNLPHKLQEEL